MRHDGPWPHSRLIFFFSLPCSFGKPSSLHLFLHPGPSFSLSHQHPSLASSQATFFFSAFSGPCTNGHVHSFFRSRIFSFSVSAPHLIVTGKRGSKKKRHLDGSAQHSPAPHLHRTQLKSHGRRFVAQPLALSCRVSPLRAGLISQSFHSFLRFGFDHHLRSLFAERICASVLRHLQRFARGNIASISPLGQITRRATPSFVGS
ncbi:hypothetical protein V8C42DRAFT_130007 [Trichoderma barbatum]